MQGHCHVRNGNVHLEYVRLLACAVGRAEPDALRNCNVRCFADIVPGKREIDTTLLVLSGDLDVRRRPIRPYDEAPLIMCRLVVEALFQRDEVVAQLAREPRDFLRACQA